MFEFLMDLDKLNERSVFANQICQMIINNHGYFLDDSELLKQVKLMQDGCEMHVRNIYELVDEEIPLFALYRLKTLGPDNWDFDEKEYKAALKRTRKACKHYYLGRYFEK